VADAEDISDENQFYTYEITATITDIGGETQTGATSIPVSRRSVFANWQLPNMLTEKEWKKAQLFTTNLSNEYTPTLLTVRIDALQAPDKLGRERYWSLPDQVNRNSKLIFRMMCIATKINLKTGLYCKPFQRIILSVSLMEKIR
jgi:hypothetical protein